MIWRRESAYHLPADNLWVRVMRSCRSVDIGRSGVLWVFPRHDAHVTEPLHPTLGTRMHAVEALTSFFACFARHEITSGGIHHNVTRARHAAFMQAWGKLLQNRFS